MNKYFEEIYKQHSDMVYKIAYKILNDESYAEDVCIEVFCKLYVYIKNNRDIQNVGGWLRIAAKTTAIDIIRKNSKEITIDSFESETTQIYQQDFVNSVINKTFTNDILNNLYKKNQKWFEYITMRYLLEMSYEEIAISTGTTEAAVKNSISRAKKYIATMYSYNSDDTMYSIILLIVGLLTINQ